MVFGRRKTEMIDPADALPGGPIHRGYRLAAAGLETNTSEPGPAPKLFHAEGCHQQCLAANPAGYCGIAGTDVTRYGK